MCLGTLRQSGQSGPTGAVARLARQPSCFKWVHSAPSFVFSVLACCTAFVRPPSAYVDAQPCSSSPHHGADEVSDYDSEVAVDVSDDDYSGIEDDRIGL